MHLEFQLTREDMEDALRAHPSRQIWRLFAGVVVLGAFLLVFMSLAQNTLSGRRSEPLMSWLPFLLGLGVLVAFVLIAPTLASRRQLRQMPSLSKPIVVDIDENGLRFRTEAADSTFAWNKLMGWSESKKLFLFFSSPRLFNFVPKRVLAPEQESELREMSQRLVGPQLKSVRAFQQR